jgi:hypothetical protein
VPHAPPAVAPPPVFKPDWETLAQLASTRSKLLNLDACFASTSLRLFWGATNKPNPLGFEAQTKKNPSRWFWGTNHQTVVASFETQTEKPWTTLVLRLNQETVTTGFEAKPEKPPPSVLRSNQRKQSPPVLRPNRRKPSQWFWGQTTNKPSTLVLRLNQEICAPRLHVHDADPHSVTRPLDRPATEYPTYATIPGPLHQVSYSCLNSRCYPPCCTCHLHTTRQENANLQTKQW